MKYYNITRSIEAVFNDEDLSIDAKQIFALLVCNVKSRGIAIKDEIILDVVNYSNYTLLDVFKYMHELIEEDAIQEVKYDTPEKRIERKLRPDNFF